MKLKAILYSGLVLALLCSCVKKNYIPKPKGYNRIDMPPHAYHLSPDTLPYQFQMSDYAVLRDDSSSFDEKYWSRIVYPAYDCSVELTYYELNNNRKFLRELVKDAYTLTSRHQIKATGIEEAVIKTPSGKTATLLEVEGEVPSQLQFFITDSSRNYLRGALYFKTALKNDSLAPVIRYMKEDILQMLNTTEWITPRTSRK
ncbi:MAG: gliding motility lipoprotein GldD [Cytophagales bacterium]|nr:gliding motility lipoprotein GldD [Cytophagales bacterium]